MFGVLYLIGSIIMSVYTTKTIYRNTDLTGYSLGSKIAFVAYFALGNLFAWPIYFILKTTRIDEEE